MSKKLYFVFDVESIGLYGQAFAVGGGIYDKDGKALREFRFACPRKLAYGSDEDRNWVDQNIKDIPVNCANPEEVREKFWGEWRLADGLGAIAFAECSYPVETNFLKECVLDEYANRRFGAPYPLHDVATLMLSAGMNPMKTYDRLENELPKHDPLADARQSARLLTRAILVNEICRKDSEEYREVQS